MSQSVLSIVRSTLLGLAVLCASAPALAQDDADPAKAPEGKEKKGPAENEGKEEEGDEEQDEEGDEEDEGQGAELEAEAKGSAKATVKAPAEGLAAASPATSGRAMRADDELEQKNGFVAPEPAHELEWHGGLELDAGYAVYNFQDPTVPREDLYDFRGRFVVGPTITHEFGDDWFVRGRAELVGWVRERTNIYQINVDDVFAQVGQKGLWDFKAGRFRAWRVYHKGLGFDLYTLEDLGACKFGNCATQNGQNFGPHTYEVSHLYNRGTAGHAAVHVYPTEWSGVELLGEYGSTDTSNILGGRLAAMITFPYVRVSGAAEYRTSRPTIEIAPPDLNGVPVPCPKCGTSVEYGFGGSLEVTVKPVEVGLNAAQTKREAFTIKDGTPDLAGSGITTSLGGYAELDVGSFTFKRSLIVGFGLNRTEVLVDTLDFDQHYQGAAYVSYPLGFNAASLKLVVSRATLLMERDSGNGIIFNEINTDTNAARLRFTYPF